MYFHNGIYSAFSIFLFHLDVVYDKIASLSQPLQEAIVPSLTNNEELYGVLKTQIDAIIYKIFMPQDILKAEHRISFKDWKIHYGACLGRGAYGVVYKLVPRPEQEKGFLSSRFPYYYDKFNPVTDAVDSEQTTLCIKIYKPMIGYLSGIDSYDDILHHYNQRTEEQEANIVLRQKRLTHVVFYESPDEYTQVKTIVNGMTLHEAVSKNLLLDPQHVALRQGLVTFFQLAQQSSLCIIDLHSKNLMFDTTHKAWDIIDCSVRRRGKKDDAIRSIVSTLLLSIPFCPKDVESLIFLLACLADQQIPYSSLKADELVRDSFHILPDDFATKYRSGSLTFPKLMQTPGVMELEEQLREINRTPSLLKEASHSTFFKTSRPNNHQIQPSGSLLSDMLWGIGLCISGGVLTNLLSKYATQNQYLASYATLAGFVVVLILYSTHNQQKSEPSIRAVFSPEPRH